MTRFQYDRDRAGGLLRSTDAPGFSHARVRAFIALTFPFHHDQAGLLGYVRERLAAVAGQIIGRNLLWLVVLESLTDLLGFDQAAAAWRKFIKHQAPTDDLELAAIQLDVIQEMAARRRPRKRKTKWVGSEK